MPEGSDQLKKANETVAEKIGIDLTKLPSPFYKDRAQPEMDTKGETIEDMSWPYRG
jgi:hypothetical protein